MAQLFKWGKFDKNDFKHLAVGSATYGILYLIAWLISLSSFDLELEPQWLALMGTFVTAYIWEFLQNKFHGALVDWKDVFVSSVPAMIITAIVEYLK